MRQLGTPVELHFYDRVWHITLLASFSRPLRFLAPVLDDFVRFVKDGAPAGEPEK